MCETCDFYLEVMDTQQEGGQGSPGGDTLCAVRVSFKILCLRRLRLERSRESLSRS